ncbi:MAG: FAD-dependent oxidoreductase [Spirochaetales bacterium]|nr:FAD-dependent oxidoreductase [Spirochaetales bacterium]
MAKKIIIIGGSAAGPKAAARARRLDQRADITLIQRGPDLSMASCGYPYYVGGVFDDRRMLLSTPTGVVRDPKFFMNAKGITALTGTEAAAIDRKRRVVSCTNLADGSANELSYDKLILATGATPKMPPVPGRDLEGITTLQSMNDADYLRKIRDERVIKKAVIIGGGLIGIETCEALELAGIEITVIEALPQLLTFLDPQLAKIVENHIRGRRANVITGNALAEFLGRDGKLTGVKLVNGTELPCELAVVAVGVKPDAALAAAAGLTVGETGGIAVDEFLKTSDPDIYAAGDCIETVNRITGKKAHAPYGDLANLQGRVAGENAACGDSVRFPGTIQTGICKVFDFSAGITGLSETAARAAGFTDIETVVIAGPDKPGFMNGKLLITKMTVNRADGRLLGLQCVGAGDVGRQIASGALAVMGKLAVTDLVNADLPYAPPFSLAIDNFIAAAHAMENKLKGRMKGIGAAEVKSLAEKMNGVFLLDVRGPDEYEAVRLGIGEVLIPLGALRKRVGELPADKGATIICFCTISLRGWEAAAFLASQGYTDVRVMEGGIAAWPYPREK